MSKNGNEMSEVKDSKHETEKRSLLCPLDGTTMSCTTYEADIEVDICPKCGGFWLDHGELENIQHTVEKDYSNELARMPDMIGAATRTLKQKSAPLVNCPVCDKKMARREHGYCSQIMVDVCPSCKGVWLDKGELQALEVFFERSRFGAGNARRGFWGTLRNLVLGKSNKNSSMK
jgi:hypothetical protein